MTPWYLPACLVCRSDWGGSERFSEQLVRLSSSLGFSFQDPSPQGRLPDDRVAAFLARHGLPTDRPIIGCPQVLPHIHSTSLPAPARALSAPRHASSLLTMW